MANKTVVLEWSGTLAQLDEIQKYLKEGYSFVGSSDWHQGALVFLDKYFLDKEVTPVSDSDVFSLKDVVTDAVADLTVKSDSPKKGRGRPKKVKTEEVSIPVVDVPTLDIPGTI